MTESSTIRAHPAGCVHNLRGHFERRQRLLLLVLAYSALGLFGCERSQDKGASQATAASDLPPSFLDAPPPAPSSPTLILSGGTVLSAGAWTEDELFDAVVVVTRGRLVAIGRRGQLDVPADSIGIDASGKFIEVQSAAAAESAAHIIVYDRPPSASSKPSVYGQLVNGRWQRAQDDEL